VHADDKPLNKSEQSEDQSNEQPERLTGKRLTETNAN